MNIEKSKTGDHTQIAALHQKHINTGFLSSIGLPFLTLLYTSMTTSKNAFCFVSREDEKIIGFISGAINVGAFYKEFIKRHFFTACFIFSPKILNSVFLKKIFETLLYPVKKRTICQKLNY